MPTANERPTPSAGSWVGAEVAPVPSATDVRPVAVLRLVHLLERSYIPNDKVVKCGRLGVYTHAAGESRKRETAGCARYKERRASLYIAMLASAGREYAVLALL